MRQIRTFRVRIKAKLQHLHAGIAGLFYKSYHRGCEEAQVLRNNLSVSKLLLHRPEQRIAGTRLPGSYLCSFPSRRNGIIGIKGSEMIDSHNIVQAKTRLKTA